MSSEIAPPVFRTRGVTKVYRMGETEVPALRGVDLQVSPGEFVVFLGPPGSGKSTLLNILGGFDTPTSGTVHFGDRDLTRDDAAGLTRYRREHIGFVPQFCNLIPGLTARQNVALASDVAEHPMEPEQALAWVGLGERLDLFPTQLSGSEQQRVAIARAVAKRPCVLLCDEPTGELDCETGRRVLEALSRINRELGITAVVNTHHPAIAGLADRVLHLGNGRIVAEEQPAPRLAPCQLSW